MLKKTNNQEFKVDICLLIFKSYCIQVYFLYVHVQNTHLPDVLRNCNSYIYMYHLMDQKLSYESFFMTQTFYYELFNGANKQLGKY